MKNKIGVTIFLIIVMMANTIFATTEVTMEIVEENICTIELNEKSTF